MNQEVYQFWLSDFTVDWGDLSKVACDDALEILKVEKHPFKTFVRRVARGFDFWGAGLYHRLPLGWKLLGRRLTTM